jgi:hypothetical protein
VPKVKYDVSNTEFGESGDFENAQPGVYSAVIKEINPGFAKGEGGKPDRSRPRLEVIYNELKPIDNPKDKTRYSQIWDYLSFSEASEYRMAQFLEAIGVATPKKRSGSWDTEKKVGTVVKVRVKADVDLNDNYRAKIAGVFAFEGGGDEEELDDEEYDEEDEEEEEVEEEEVEEYDEEAEEDYSDWSVGDLKEELEERGLSTSGRKNTLVKRLEDDNAAAEEEEEEEPEEEEDEELEDEESDEEDEEDEEEEEESYTEWSVAELRDEAGERDLSTSGSKKALIARLEEDNEGAEEEEDEEEEEAAPF